MNKPKCLLCQSSLQTAGLQLGPLPPCNRFESSAAAVSEGYPLSLQACSSCGLIQLVDPPPLAALVPQVPWLRYNEPDAHLEAVSAVLLKHLKKQERAYGVGPFDQPLLNYLQAQGLACETLHFSAIEKSRQAQRFPYLETIQACLQPEPLKKLAAEKGRGQLVVCRYLLEHCRCPLEALAGLLALIQEDGLALIEVPDSSKFLKQKDYSFIWEEHVCYFTEDSFTALLHQGGFKLIELLKFEGQLEDAMVALVQPADLTLSKDHLETSPPALFAHYAEAFPKIRAAYQQTLVTITAGGGKIAIFGAGHQAIMFMNALGLNDYIACLVDDDSNKQAYFSPGAGLPIVSSATMLADTQIDTCLLAVSPRIESKIQEKCAAFLQRGGKMYSIFPGSRLSSVLAATHFTEPTLCN